MPARPPAAGRKVLVFAHHGAVLDALEQHLEPQLRAMKPAASLVKIKGSTSADARHKAERCFQTDRNCRLAVLSVGTAGVNSLIPPHMRTLPNTSPRPCAVTRTINSMCDVRDNSIFCSLAATLTLIPMARTRNGRCLRPDRV